MDSSIYIVVQQVLLLLAYIHLVEPLCMKMPLFQQHWNQICLWQPKPKKTLILLYDIEKCATDKWSVSVSFVGVQDIQFLNDGLYIMDRDSSWILFHNHIRRFISCKTWGLLRVCAIRPRPLSLCICSEWGWKNMYWCDDKSNHH